MYYSLFINILSETTFYATLCQVNLCKIPTQHVFVSMTQQSTLVGMNNLSFLSAWIT